MLNDEIILVRASPINIARFRELSSLSEDDTVYSIYSKLLKNVLLVYQFTFPVKLHVPVAYCVSFRRLECNECR